MISFNDESKRAVCAALFGISAGFYVISGLMSLGYMRFGSILAISSILYAFFYGALAYIIYKTKNPNHLKVTIGILIVVVVIVSVVGSSGSWGYILLVLIFDFLTYGMLELYVINNFAENEGKTVQKSTYMIPLVLFGISIGLLAISVIGSFRFISLLPANVGNLFASIAFFVFIYFTKPTSLKTTVDGQPQGSDVSPMKGMSADEFNEINNLYNQNAITIDEYEALQSKFEKSEDNSVKEDIEEIKSLKQLLDNGTITEEEYNQMKKPFLDY